jgi:hypothetical protein
MRRLCNGYSITLEHEEESPIDNCFTTIDLHFITEPMNTQQEFDAFEESISKMQSLTPLHYSAVNGSNPYSKTNMPISNPYSKTPNMGNGKVANPYRSTNKRNTVKNPYKTRKLPMKIVHEQHRHAKSPTIPSNRHITLLLGDHHCRTIMENYGNAIRFHFKQWS